MNAQELREWLSYAPGKQMETDNFLVQFMIGAVPGGPANSSTEQYFPCLVQKQTKPSGFGYRLMITGCFNAGKHAVYVKDHPNQSLHADASAAPIVISGRFSGCTFARCTGGNGHDYVAHIFVDGADANNNPAAQARAFEVAVGAPANSAVGFQTVGAVAAPAMRGYVFGTHVGGAWNWKWLTATHDGTVSICRDIAGHEWVAL